jgi:hypothetical protein
LLLACEADVNARSKINATPLHFAALKGHNDMAKLLLACEADVNARSKINATPLHFAALKGHNDMAKLLLACEADVDVKESKYGQTPLELAAAQGHKEVANLLRWHHAKLSAPLPVENQKPIAVSSPALEGVEDNSEELKWWHNPAIIFVVLTVIVLGGLVWAVVKLFMEK